MPMAIDNNLMRSLQPENDGEAMDEQVTALKDVEQLGDEHATGTVAAIGTLCTCHSMQSAAAAALLGGGA